MGRNKRPPSAPVRIEVDILLRVKREWPNGGTLRDKVKAALVWACDNKDYTPVRLLGRIDELVKSQKAKRKKK